MKQTMPKRGFNSWRGGAKRGRVGQEKGRGEEGRGGGDRGGEKRVSAARQDSDCVRMVLEAFQGEDGVVGLHDHVVRLVRKYAARRRQLDDTSRGFARACDRKPTRSSSDPPLQALGSALGRASGRLDINWRPQ